MVHENQQSYIRVSCLATKMSQAFPLRKERPAKEDTLIHVKPLLHLHPVEELHIIRERVVGLSRGCISSAWSSWGEILMVGFYGSSAVSVWLMIIPWLAHLKSWYEHQKIKKLWISERKLLFQRFPKHQILRIQCCSCRVDSSENTRIFWSDPSVGTPVEATHKQNVRHHPPSGGD